MDYKDYKIQKQKNVNFEHFWHKARKKLIFNLLNFVFVNYSNDRIILDIGAGTGTEIKEIKKFGNVTAFDINEKALKIAKNLGHKIILGDIEKYNLKSNVYDCVCCFDILEHLDKDTKVIKKIHSSLKKDGYLIFTVPSYQALFGQHDMALEHKRRYSKKEINNKLKKIGFEIIKIGYWNSILFPLIAFFRLIKIIIYKIFNIKKCQTESRPVNKYINDLFYFILNLENKAFKKKNSFPFGLSIYGIAKK